MFPAACGFIVVGRIISHDLSYRASELMECEMCNQHGCIPDNVALFTYEYDGKDYEV